MSSAMNRRPWESGWSIVTAIKTRNPARLILKKFACHMVIVTFFVHLFIFKSPLVIDMPLAMATFLVVSPTKDLDASQ
jgi:hypothetical protein